MPTAWWLVDVDGVVRWARETGGQVELLGEDMRPDLRHPVAVKTSVRESMQTLLGKDAQVEKCALGPTGYHPRIWRPGFSPAPWSYPSSHWAESVQAASILFDEMGRVFRCVEPTADNAHTYGHEIRQLLILACTEFEGACRAIMNANEYANPEKTKDYVKLRDRMRLHDWTVSLRWHASFPAFSPFQTWEANQPTQSLPWYHAYNGAKHDRSANFPQASLENMVHAMGALFVLVSAQYGTWHGDEATVGPFAPEGFVNEHFRVEARPNWEPFDRSPDVPRGMPSTWTAVPLFA